MSYFIENTRSNVKAIKVEELKSTSIESNSSYQLITKITKLLDDIKRLVMDINPSAEISNLFIEMLEISAEFLSVTKKLEKQFIDANTPTKIAQINVNIIDIYNTMAILSLQIQSQCEEVLDIKKPLFYLDKCSSILESDKNIIYLRHISNSYYNFSVKLYGMSKIEECIVPLCKSCDILEESLKIKDKDNESQLSKYPKKLLLLASCQQKAEQYQEALQTLYKCIAYSLKYCKDSIISTIESLVNIRFIYSSCTEDLDLESIFSKVEEEEDIYYCIKCWQTTLLRYPYIRSDENKMLFVKDLNSLIEYQTETFNDIETVDSIRISIMRAKLMFYNSGSKNATQYIKKTLFPSVITNSSLESYPADILIEVASILIQLSLVQIESDNRTDSIQCINNAVYILDLIGSVKEENSCEYLQDLLNNTSKDC